MTSRALWQRCRTGLAVLTLRAPFWRRSWKHRVARHALSVVYVYLSILLVLLALEDRLLFHPGDTALVAPPPGLAVEDVEATTADGVSIHGWWSAPPGWGPERGAILYAHGNGRNLSHRGHYITDWQRSLGQAVLMFDYPGYGRSGGEPSEAGCYAAADAAYDWLVRHKQVPPGRVLVCGGSLGGAVAVDLASRRPCRALVLVSTFTSFPDIAQDVYPWLPARWLVHNRFRSIDKIASCSVPVFITHGTADGLIPLRHGQRLLAAVPGPRQFLALEGKYHLDYLTPDACAALSAFLGEHENAAAD